jgi:hypothetical protein
MPNNHDAPKTIPMAVTSVAGSPASHSTNSNGLRMPRQDQGALPEAYADMWRNAGDPHTGAALYPSILGKINVDLMQKDKK